MELRSWAIATSLLVGTVVPASAQQVVTRGVVDSINPITGQLRLRKITGAYQDIQVAPNAEVRVGGRTATLEQVPMSADADVLVWRDPGGGLHAQRIVIRGPRSLAGTAIPAASAAIEGEVLGIQPLTSTIALRTTNGVRNVSLGTAPVMMNCRQITPFDLAIGDRVRISMLPPQPGLVPGPAVATVLPSERVAGKRETFRAMVAAKAIRPPSRTIIAANGTPSAAPRADTAPVAVPPVTVAPVPVPADQPGIVIAPKHPLTHATVQARIRARLLAAHRAAIARKRALARKHAKAAHIATSTSK